MGKMYLVGQLLIIMWLQKPIYKHKKGVIYFAKVTMTMTTNHIKHVIDHKYNTTITQYNTRCGI